MRINIHLKRLMIIVFVCFLAVLNCKMVSASTKEIVKVGYIDYDGFINKDANGKMVGYGVEYLEEIAKTTGWEYEYVFDTWQVLLEKLAAGEIDLLCSAQKTVEREKIYDFSKNSIGIESSILYAKIDSDIYYNDFKVMNNKKIGFLNSSFQNQVFEDYANENNFKHQDFYFDDDQSMFQALENNEVDIIVTGSLARHPELKAIGKYGSDPFYFMITKGNHKIRNLINTTLDDIIVDNPNFENELFNKYYSGYFAHYNPLLTREEADFIKQSGVIDVGQLEQRHPMSRFQDEKFDGIMIDLMKLISAKSGLVFNNVLIHENEVPLDLLNAEKIDLIAGLARTKERLTNQDYIFSKTVFSSSVVAVGRIGELYDKDENNIIVINKTSEAYEQKILDNFPNSTIVYENSDALCGDSILNKKADLFFQNYYIIHELIQNPRYDELEAVPTFELIEDLGIVGLRKDSQILISIINKTINVINEEDSSRILIKHTIVEPYKMTFGDIAFKFRVPLGVIALLIIFICTLVIATINVQKKHNKVLKIKNDQLTQAIKQAESATQAERMFLSKMSHEIRTPMNAIIGITTLAEKHIDEKSKLEDYFKKINISSRHLLNIVNDVLDMSAIENERLKISIAPFDLKQMIESTTSLFYMQCKEKNIEFKVVLDNIQNEKLLGDQLRTNQILSNLLSNAVKFTNPTGSIMLTITQKDIDNKTIFLKFIVSDTGKGMSKEYLKGIFTPFNQEDSSIARKYGGSGLGLSITKNLVDIMHGAISVESEVDKGSTFKVEIPFEIDDTAKNISLANAASIKTLVIDDDEDTLEYTTSILDRFGVNYTCVNSGYQALEQMSLARNEGTDFKLCLIDWKMPEFDGVQTARKIRELYGEETIVIIISAYDINEVEPLAKAAGVNMCINKPIFQSTVFDILMRLSGGKLANIDTDEEDYDFSGKRILLVEDTIFSREVAVELLELVNAEVECAENGQEAVDKFISHDPYYYDIILMDIQMPVLNGYDATKVIRSSDKDDAKDIPILAMTANAFTEDIAMSLSCGMNDHISKPINTSVLYKILSKHLKKAGK